MQKDTDYFTLTSVAGRFVFPRKTILSHAKLVRDTVTAGFLGAIPHTPRPKPDNVVGWLHNHVMGPVRSQVTFEWELI